MKRICVISIIILMFLTAIPTFAAPGDNLCENAVVIDYSGAVAAEDEQVGACIDGDISTKWCSSGISDSEYSKNYGAENWIVLDLGESKYFNRYQLFHASLCDRDFGETQLDTVSWILEVSDDLETWKEISKVTDNKEAFNDIETELVCARYVRLLILEENRDENSILRLSEIKIIESDNAGTVTENDSSDAEEALKAMEEAEKLREQEAQNEKNEVLIFSLMVMSMVIALIIFYTLKFINMRSQKGGNK